MRQNLTCKPVKESLFTPTPPTSTPSTLALPAPALAGQKSKSNLLDRQEHPILAAKNLEYQALNPDISLEKV